MGLLPPMEGPFFLRFSPKWAVQFTRRRCVNATQQDSFHQLERRKMERHRPKKVGIIRCQHTEDLCPGTTDFKVARRGKCAFEEIGPVQVVGFVSCGGCPGKRSAGRAKIMVERGAEVIALGSCIKKGNPIDYPCPHFESIKRAIEKAVGDGVLVLDYTH